MVQSSYFWIFNFFSWFLNQAKLKNVKVVDFEISNNIETISQSALSLLLMKLQKALKLRLRRGRIRRNCLAATMFVGPVHWRHLSSSVSWETSIFVQHGNKKRRECRSSGRCLFVQDSGWRSTSNSFYQVERMPHLHQGSHALILFSYPTRWVFLTQ